MKRFHVHVAVAELSESIRFYSTLFGVEPAVRKDDYAKWMLDGSAHQFRDIPARQYRRRQSPGVPGRVRCGARSGA
jgi:catechol 2,3-dioxygenase-like lactoylglutathione lyase family enzyme